MDTSLEADKTGAAGFDLRGEFATAGGASLLFVAFFEEVEGRAALASVLFFAASSFLFASSNFCILFLSVEYTFLFPRRRSLWFSIGWWFEANSL